MKIDPTIKIGDLLTVFSVMVAALSLLNAWRKDRQIKKKESADRIRKAAGIVIAKLERWKELTLRFYDDIQPCFVDADAMLVKEGNGIATRDYVWKELVTLQAAASQRITGEQIEVAYADLYGYDPRIQELFSETIAKLKRVGKEQNSLVLEMTQLEILNLSNVSNKSGLMRHSLFCLSSPSDDWLCTRLSEDAFKNTQTAYGSSVLGNKLRSTCETLREQSAKQIDGIIVPFRQEILKLITAKDNEIVNHNIKIALPAEVLPSEFLTAEDIMKIKFGYRLKSNIIILGSCETYTINALYDSYKNNYLPPAT